MISIKMILNISLSFYERILKRKSTNQSKLVKKKVRFSTRTNFEYPGSMVMLIVCKFDFWTCVDPSSITRNL